MSARLSILLPVHNGGDFLPRQLDSILAQTDPDFELVAVDDGSGDGSASVLADYAAREPRMRLLPGGGNEGQSIRLRELLDAAGGALVAFADQDDVWAPDRNARLLAAMGDRALAFGRSELVDAAEAPLGRTLLDSLGLTPEPAMRLRCLFKPLVSAHAAIVRRERIDPAVFAHPLPFDWLIGASASFGGGLAYVDGAVVRHRIHGGNQMNRAAPDATRRLAAARNRYAFLLRRPAQLRFWLMLDFLGRAAAVPSPSRRLFARLAAACRDGWYNGVPKPAVFGEPKLRERLLAGLEPMAGSPEDLRAARREIGLLTRTLANPAKMAQVLGGLAHPAVPESGRPA